jgi:hypothetical protein
MAITVSFLAGRHCVSPDHVTARWGTMIKTLLLNTNAGVNGVAHRTPATISSKMKAMQSDKLRELREALVNAGFLTLDQQANSLGLSRSTAWTVLKGNHKGSGLSATLIKRMLASPQLPPAAAKIIHEYVERKAAGAYGHSKERLRLFRAQIKTLDNLHMAPSAPGR